jgi:hypothetical protein
MTTDSEAETRREVEDGAAYLARLLAEAEETGRSLESVEKLVAWRYKDSDEARARRELQDQIRAESEQYLLAPVSAWPEIKIKWDLSQESQHLSLDHSQAFYTRPRFDRDYPEGFLLGWVSLRDFDAKLCAFNHRTEEQLWKVGDVFKLANLIVYLSQGRPVSPSAVRVTEQRELFLLGGNHRYAVAKAIDESALPIHALPGQKELLESLLQVRWA